MGWFRGCTGPVGNGVGAEGSRTGVEWVVCAPTLCLLSGRAAASPGPSALEINLPRGPAGLQPCATVSGSLEIRRTLLAHRRKQEARRVQFNSTSFSPSEVGHLERTRA